MLECRRHSHGWAVVVLSAAALATAAARSQIGPLTSEERPSTSYNNLAGPSSFYYRGTRSLGHAAQKERQETPPSESQQSPEFAERERSPETPSAQVSPKNSSDEGGNSSRVESNAIATEYESVREPKFVGRFKDWYRGREKEKDKDKEREIVVIATGPAPHAHYPPAHHHVPVLIGSVTHAHEHPVVVTRPVTQYVTVPQPVAVTHTETITRTTPSVVVQTSHVTYVTPSVVTAYVTPSAVTTYVTQSQAPTYVTSVTTTYITHSLTPTYVMSSVVTAYVTQSHAPSYVTSVTTTYVTQTHAPTYVTPSVVTAFVTQTHPPTHVVPPYIPTYVTPSHVFIQEPHPVTVSVMHPHTQPTITHTITLHEDNPITQTHIKGTYSGQGHFELQKSTLKLDALNIKNDKPPGCTHCG